MAVLVTGGLGAIGNWVLRCLTEKGVEPVTLDQKLDFTLVADIKDKIQFVQGDILDFPLLARVFKDNQIDRVIHLAALMPVPAQTNPYMGIQVNCQGTLNLLELSRVFGVKRFVFASSKAVYGNIVGQHGHPHYEPVNEDYRKQPDSIYGATKSFCEDVGLNYWESFGLDFIALRFASTYGPGKLARHGPMGMQSLIIENAFFGRPTRLVKGGDQMDDMIYNYDVGEAVTLACLKEETKSKIFNIGCGQRTSLKELSQILLAKCPGAEIEIGPGLDYFNNNTQHYGIFDIGRAQKELGFKPRFDLEKGVDHYFAYLQPEA